MSYQTPTAPELCRTHTLSLQMSNMYLSGSANLCELMCSVIGDL